MTVTVAPWANVFKDLIMINCKTVEELSVIIIDNAIRTHVRYSVDFTIV